MITKRHSKESVLKKINYLYNSVLDYLLIIVLKYVLSISIIKMNLNYQ